MKEEVKLSFARSESEGKEDGFSFAFVFYQPALFLIGHPN